MAGGESLRALGMYVLSFVAALNTADAELFNWPSDAGSLAGRVLGDLLSPLSKYVLYSISIFMRRVYKSPKCYP